MGLTVADVCQLPNEANEIISGLPLNEFQKGYNFALSEISSLKLSPEKVVGMVEIDENRLIEFAQSHCRELYDVKGEADEYHEKFGALIYFSKAIVSNKSKILGVKGKLG